MGKTADGMEELGTNERNWEEHYQELVVFMRGHGRLPSRHHVEEHRLLNWVKYQRKKARLGTLGVEELRKLELLNVIKTNG